MDPTFYASYFRHETTHWWFRWRFDLIDRVLGTMRQGRPLRILDAGCGTGQMLKCLEAHGDAIGIDTSPQAIGYAKARGVRRLVQGSITDLPFRDATFDCVLALDVIEHVDDDVGILAKLYGVVKPGGHLIVTVPAFQTLWSEHDEINLHKRRYRADHLRRLIEEAGFDLHRVTYCNTALFLPVLAMRKAKNLLRSVRRARGTTSGNLESDLNEYSTPINSALYWLLRSETRLMRRVNLPFGVSILAIARRPITQAADAVTVAGAATPVRPASSFASEQARARLSTGLGAGPSPADVAEEVAAL